MQTPHTRVAVVGGGPYGLSVSAHLSARGIEHRIFGRPMSLWDEHMPNGMFLKSEGRASSLGDPAAARTLRHYAEERGFPYADTGVPVALQHFVGYGRWFQEHLVSHVEPVEVTGLRRLGSRFELGLAQGASLTADRVVLAIGVQAFRYLPPPLSALPPVVASHSVDHGDLSRFSGRSVIVLGGGQGALETAALLHEGGAEVRVLVRSHGVRWNSVPFNRSLRSRIRYPESSLGTGWRTRCYADLPGAFRRLPPDARLEIVRTALGPAGSWWLRQRVEGVLPISVGTRVMGAELVGEALKLTLDGSDGVSTVTADHVISGTGFHVDLARLGFLDPELRHQVTTFGGYPVLDRGFESSAPGLHFAGLAAAGSFGPVQRFVAGTDYTARKLAAAAARPVRRRERRADRRRAGELSGP